MANDIAVIRAKDQPAVERTAKPVGRPRRYETPEQMQAVIDGYFLTTDRPTICGLALALGFVSRQSFYDYQGYDPDFDYTLKRARLRVECRYEEMLREPGCARAAIFALKHFGWRDNPPPTHEDSPPVLPPVVYVTAGGGDRLRQ